MWGKELTALQIITENYQSLIYKLTLISNFVSNEVYAINGPWWFISLIIQFYGKNYKRTELNKVSL